MSASIRPKSGKASSSWMKDVLHETALVGDRQIPLSREGSRRDSRRLQAQAQAAFADTYAAGSNRPSTAGLARAVYGQKPKHPVGTFSSSTGRPQSAHPALRSTSNSRQAERAAGEQGGPGLDCVTEDADHTADSPRDNIAGGPTEQVQEQGVAESGGERKDADGERREQTIRSAAGAGSSEGDGEKPDETTADDIMQLGELDSSNSPKVKSWTGVFPDGSRPASAPVTAVHQSGTRFFTSSEAFEDWIMSREKKFLLQRIKREEEYRRGQQARAQARRDENAPNRMPSNPEKHRGGQRPQRPVTASVLYDSDNRSLSPLRMNSRDSLCLSLGNLSKEPPFNTTKGVRVPVSSNPLYIDKVLKVMESQKDVRYRSEVFILALAV